MLSNIDIKEILKSGDLKITPFNSRNLGPNTIDLTSSNEWWLYKKNIKNINIKKSWKDYMVKQKSEKIILQPHQKCLISTKEKISLPPYLTGIISGRNKYLRLGLNISTTSFVQSSSSEKIIFQIDNTNSIPVTLYSGEKLIQIAFVLLTSKTTKPYIKYKKL